MRQLHLVVAPPPPVPAVVDLELLDAGEMLQGVPPRSADLVIADPPWSTYRERPGGRDGVSPAEVYPVLSEAEIGVHLAAAVQVLRPGGRLALWTCWPLLVEALQAPAGELPPWLEIPGLLWRTGGAWSKGGAPGVGFHWRGHSEPVLVGVTRGTCGRHSDPDGHSRKPAAWMAEWVAAWVPPGGLVVDLYAGTGSAVEAVLLAGEGRRYIGAEIDPERHAGALARASRCRPLTL
jgi:hypothetical protein